MDGQLDIVKLLVSVFEADVGHGDTSFHQHASSDSVECLQVLLSPHSPLMVRNSSGKTPRDVATPECQTLLDECMKKYSDKIRVHHTTTLTSVPLCLETLTLIKWMDEQGLHTFRLVDEVASEWEAIGIRFGHKSNELEGWKEECHWKAERCWEKVMGAWLNDAGTNAYPATWEGVVRVLEDIKFIEVARELERVLASKIDSPPVQQFTTTSAASKSIAVIPQVLPPQPPPLRHPYLSVPSSTLNPTLSLLSSYLLLLGKCPSPQQLLFSLMLPQVKPPLSGSSPSPPPSP
jgi:hypothetical protein